MTYKSAGRPGIPVASNPGRSRMIHRVDGAIAPSGLFPDPVGWSMGAMHSDGVLDPGSALGDYGMGGKGLCYELISRVPLVVYDPRLPAEKRHTKPLKLRIETSASRT